MIKIGTLFSGIGSPEEALKKIGIKYSLEFSCEIDKFARKSFLVNHNPKIFYEDITKIDLNEIPYVDILIAGFPCQAFSIAGKRLGFEDKRGNLFFDLYNVIKKIRPKVFILENVKGLISHDKGKTFDIIKSMLAKRENNQDLMFVSNDSLEYNIFYQVLNTKDYSIPQNRERIFIIGFEEEINGFKFPKKEKLKIFLKDLLEKEVNEKYFISDKYLNFIKNTKFRSDKNIIQEKEYCDCLKSQGSVKCVKLNQIGSLSENNNEASRIYDLTLSRTLKASGETGLYCVGNINPSKNGMNGNVYVGNINPTVLWNKGEGTKRLLNNRIRRLTPLECFRLQGFSDEFFNNCKKQGISDSQLYKQAGNSITVNVIEKIFKEIVKLNLF